MSGFLPWNRREFVKAGVATTAAAAFGCAPQGTLNRFITEYAASGSPTLPAYLQSSLAGDIVAAADARNDPDHYPMWAGQGVGMIHDVPGAGGVVEAIVREARAVLGAFAAEVRLG